MTPHVHFSAVHGIGVLALYVAVFGTLHLIALTHDNRVTRAWVSLGN